MSNNVQQVNKVCDCLSFGTFLVIDRVVTLTPRTVP